MNIVQITPGAGAMYCGNCLRDNALVAALRKLGHDVLMVPLYLPLTLDEEDQSAGTPIFFGGINVYLQQKSALFRKTPRVVYEQYLQSADWIGNDFYPVSGWNQPTWIPRIGIVPRRIVKSCGASAPPRSKCRAAASSRPRS